MFRMVVLFVLSVFGCLSVRQASALKECLQVVRTRYDEPECEIPIIPRTYCHGASCLVNQERQNGIDKLRTHLDFQDSCAFVAHSYLTEFEIYDVVLFHVDACQGELIQGELTYEAALQVMPTNEELVAIRIPGSMLLAALEHGFLKAPKGGEPRLAGARFELSSGNGLSNIHTLSNGCRWQAIEMEKTYSVLTLESLAHGAFGYKLLHGGTSVANSPRAAWMHRKLTDMFYKHANYVCWLTDPFRKPQQAKSAKKFEGISTLVTIPMQSNLRRAANSTSTF